jgi:Glycosyl hydrolases family 16
VRSTTEERNHARPAPARAPAPGPLDRAPDAEPAEATQPIPAADTPDAVDAGRTDDTVDAPVLEAPAAEVAPGDGGDGGRDDDGPGADGTAADTPRRSRRRRALVVLLVLVLAAVAVSPLSPVSPLRPQRDEHARVPIPDRGVRVTTTTAPETTGPKVPQAEPAPVTPLTTLPAAPGDTLPGGAPAPGDPAPAPPSVPTPGPIAGAGYGLAFNDEFGGSAPNTSVWQTAPFGGALPATIRDGHLTITSTEANDYMWGHVSSSGPRSEGEPDYPQALSWQEGYFEARLRYTDNPWSWPAFWLFSQHKAEAWPDEECSQLTSEWDMMENGVQNGPGERPAGRWYFTALHRNTDNNTAGGYCDTPDEQRTYSTEVPGVDLADWHTWGGYWSADRMCTYLDGVELQCMEPYDTTAQPMQLIFTMQYLSRCDGCGPRPASLEMQVDWVRVWQR